MMRRDAEADRLPHFVDPAPFVIEEAERLTPAMERDHMAPQWKLIWWKFRRHRLAVISAALLIFFYLSVLFAEFLAPYGLNDRHTGFIYAPQRLRLFHDGRFVGPFVYGLDYQLNMEMLAREYRVNTEKVQRVRFFCRGDHYAWFGVVRSNHT